ncbi:MAG: serine protease [Patescibacteria group bacterium]
MNLIFKIFLIFTIPFILLLANIKINTFVEEVPLANKEEEVATTTPIIKEEEKNIVVESEKVPEKTTILETIVTKPPILAIPLPQETVDFEAINTKVRTAIVNIFCLAKGNSLQPITGSGVFVDPKGIILTNAHIGQYFLLDDFVDCYIRMGNPATAKYHAKLIYISQKWIKENSKNIIVENPKGTGEGDYAFLAIEKTIDNSPLPSVFPYLEIEMEEDAQKGDSVLVVGYPAGFLGGISVQNNLSSLSSIGIIGDIFTFNENTIDLLSINGSLLAQKGSSGGSVVNKDTKIVGIVATATQESETGKRELRAVTTNHIGRSLFSEISKNISLFFSGDMLEKIINFELIYKQSLSEILINEIKSKNQQN